VPPRLSSLPASPSAAAVDGEDVFGCVGEELSLLLLLLRFLLFGKAVIEIGSLFATTRIRRILRGAGGTDGAALGALEEEEDTGEGGLASKDEAFMEDVVVGACGDPVAGRGGFVCDALAVATAVSVHIGEEEEVEEALELVE